MIIRSVGHGALDAESFGRVLLDAGIDMVVDIRRYPGSRRQPHVRGEEMARWLGEAGIDHRWIEALGGRRRSNPHSPNTGLTNAQFRAYADHMATEDFAAGITTLLEVARSDSATVMCSESVWWRCHRRLVADHLVLVEGVEVRHLFHDGRSAPHPPMPEARVDDGHLVYDREAS